MGENDDLIAHLSQVTLDSLGTGTIRDKEPPGAYTSSLYRPGSVGAQLRHRREIMLSSWQRNTRSLFCHGGMDPGAAAESLGNRPPDQLHVDHWRGVDDLAFDSMCRATFSYDAIVDQTGTRLVPRPHSKPRPAKLNAVKEESQRLPNARVMRF